MPRYSREQVDEAKEKFAYDFNNIPLSLIEKAYPEEWFDYIVYPSEDYLINEAMSDSGEEWDEVSENDKEDRIAEVRDGITSMWGTIFEAKGSFLSEKLLDHIDELAEIGIYVMDGLGELNACLFIAGAGYDFYEEHWVPMYILFDEMRAK